MTITTPLPPTELTVAALRVLIHEMGIVNTARFLNQFTLGYGNYTEERDHLFGQITVDEIVQAIKTTSTANQ